MLQLWRALPQIEAVDGSGELKALIAEGEEERAFNLHPNWPLHLSTTQGVNQHLSNESGDKGGEEKREGVSDVTQKRKWETATEKEWIRGMEGESDE